MAVLAGRSLIDALRPAFDGSATAVVAPDEVTGGVTGEVTGGVTGDGLDGWLRGLDRIRAVVVEGVPAPGDAGQAGPAPVGDVEYVRGLARQVRPVARFLSQRRGAALICVLRHPAPDRVVNESMSAFVRCAATELAHYGVPVWGVLVGTGEPDPADGAAPALAVAGHLVRMLIGAPPPASTGDVFLIAGTTVRRLMAPTVERELIRADRRLVAADLAEVLPGALGLPVPARPSPAPAVSDGMSGRVAIVTGGSGGIGRAVALELASQNVAVVVADLGCDADGQGRNAGPAEEVAAQIRLRGGQAVAVCADVSCPQECRNLVDQAVQTFGRVDALCHAAGVVRQALVFESTDEDWARVLDVHLDGARQLVDACLDPMRHQRYGRIVLFSSRSVAGSPGLGAYSAAKGAVLAYGRMLAGQVGGRGICVNVVLPSGRTRASMPQAPDARRRRVELLRARHHGISDPVAYRNSPRQDPENNAAMIAWLCGEPAGAVNGRIFSTGDWRVELYRASTVTAPVTLPSHAIADIRALWPDPAGQAR